MALLVILLGAAILLIAGVQAGSVRAATMTPNAAEDSRHETSAPSRRCRGPPSSAGLPIDPTAGASPLAATASAGPSPVMSLQPDPSLDLEVPEVPAVRPIPVDNA